MGGYEESTYFGVKWNVFVVKTKADGLAAIKRGEKAVKFHWDCNLKPDDAKEIAAELRKSSTLLLLDLYGNDIGDQGAESIADALKVNKTLQSLSLGANNIGDQGAESIADALKVNKTLQSLNLYSNNIGAQGAESIADALKVNKSLQSLNLARNNIGAQGAESIADALKVNKTLQTLYLWKNNIGDQGAESIADALKVNKSLQSLDLDSNNITDSELRSQINACLAQNRQRPRKSLTAEEREELEKHFAAALENGDLQEWGRAKLMVIGEGAAGKTSTVRSLLGLAPVSDHISTVGVDLKVTRTEDWNERPAKESDYDRMANKAAANRKVNGGKPKVEVKSEKRRSGLRESIRKSLNRFSRSLSKRESLRPEDIVPSSSALRRLNDEKEVARRFDFEGARALAAKTGSGMDVSFSIWDYGGQEVFYALHHIFLSKQGVYLLVFDMSRILALDEEAIEFVEFWLNSVKLHSPEAPIIMVGTRGDQVKSILDLDKVNRVLCEELKVLQYPVVENGDYFFFPIDNSNESSSRASTLRKAVECAASELKCVKKLVPLAWMRVLDEIFVSGEKYMARADVVKLASEYGISNKQADEMLSTFHDLGVLVHQRATERLIETVVLEPQWLLDKLSSVINDHQHSKRAIFDSKVKKTGKIRNDLVSYRQNGIATRSLLEYLWENEKVDFLIDFMKDTMLICDLNGKEKEERKYLVTSLMIQEVLVDRKLDLEEFEGGLKCVLDFSEFFLPKGVFQRLVSTCTSVSLREPELSRKEAVVMIEDDAIALIEEKNRISIILLEDAENGPSALKTLISMVREQKELLMPDLVWKLLLQSPKKTKPVLVDYEAILEAKQSGQEKVVPVKSRKAVPVSDFDPFFEDESIGRLDTDKEGSVVPKCRLKKLPSDIKYHVFISHKQETAADMAGTLATKLEARGLKVWYDQALDGNLSEVEMNRGIKESKCYLLLLTKNVFESDAVKMELRTATELGKPIRMVHESQTNVSGFAPFREYIEGCPPEAKSLFNERESMPFQRRKYLADPFLDELVKRIDQS